MRARWVVLLIVLAFVAGSSALRAAGWTGRAPAGLPAQPYERLEADDPAAWQTLADAPFAIGGGEFHAEVRGHARVTTGERHPFEMRILRTGGEDARLKITVLPNGDVGMPTGTRLVDGVWVTPLEVLGILDNASLLAEARVEAFRPASAMGYFEAGETRVALPFTFEAARGATGS